MSLHEISSKQIGRTLAAIFGLLLTACSGMSAQSASGGFRQRSPVLQQVAIKNVSIIDVETGLVRPGMTILVRNGVIDRVARKMTLPRRTNVIDGTGKFVIPGLWDMHTHIEAVGERSLPLYIANGVLGVRDMAADADFIFPLRRQVEAGDLLGPAILAAGPMIDSAPTDWPLRLKVDTKEAAEKAVRELKILGADFIKVHDNTPRPVYFAVAEETKRLGMRFAGHVPKSVTIAEAVQSGQHSIEHLAGYREIIECSGGLTYSRDKCAPLYAEMAKRQVWQTPTLSYDRAIPNAFVNGAPLPHSEFASRELLEFQAKNRAASKMTPKIEALIGQLARTALPAIRDMKSAGVPFLAGCDSLVPGFCLHDELELLTSAGFTPLEALQTATINPERYAGRGTGVALIAPGRAANLVLLRSNPLTDIRNTRTIDSVVLRGMWIGPEQIRRILDAARVPEASGSRG